MKKSIKILIFIAIIIIFLLSFLLLNRSLTGNVIRQQELNLYSYTKAICNSTNYCQDNEITCEGNTTISVIPITGAVIQHSKEWIDPRDEKEKDKLC
jgi:hypothetical protein